MARGGTEEPYPVCGGDEDMTEAGVSAGPGGANAAAAEEKI